MAADNPSPTSFLTALLSGGIAGTSVDVALYPLDTIKTRMQSPHGFFKAGGVSGIYRGLSAAAAGSAPGAALFFSTYETMKKTIGGSGSGDNKLPGPVMHMISASVGEVAACLVRVPTEVIKQRMQTGMHSSISHTTREIFSNEGGVIGLYRGFGITIMREIPFALVQFPIYEFLKCKVAELNGREVHALEAAACGSFSGAIAAAVTTPLDVIKTRLMLGKDANGVPYRGAIDTFRRLWAESACGSSSAINSNGNRNGNGHGSSSASVSQQRMRLFFTGVQPRVMWIGIGGFIFFGAYDQAVKITKPLFH